MGGTGGPSGTGQAGGTGTGGAQASSQWPGIDQAQFQALKNVGGSYNPASMPSGGSPTTNMPTMNPVSPNSPLTPAGGNMPTMNPVQPNSPLTPASGNPSTNNSLIGGAINTPYWQQQYATNPSGVQGMFSPPAANQLSQFYPGQQIFPGVQGSGTGPSGGYGAGSNSAGGKGAGINPGGAVQGANGGSQLKQIVGSLGGGAQA